MKQMRFSKIIYYLVFSIFVVVSLGLSGTQSHAATYLKIGLPEGPRTLNIWLASDRGSHQILSQIYQPLYKRDPETLNLIPWLAEGEPEFAAETLSYTVRIKPAKWSDGSEVTSEDVAFTGRLIHEFKVPRYASRWNFIKKIETPDKHTVKFYLKEPKSIFLSRTLTTTVVQKKEWIQVVERARNSEKPLITLLNHKINKPVGTGPFVLKEWKQGAYLFLQKNEYFFGAGREIAGLQLGPYIDGIIFKIYTTSDAAILALKKGSIDMFWWSIQAGYLHDLRKQKDIQLFSSEKSGLYYLGFNVRKPPFNDLSFRHSVATLIDKEFIVSRILQGLATKMDSIVPPGNKFWYCPNTPRYGKGLTREERIKKAYEILRKAGYTWKVPPVTGEGEVGKGKGIRLPDGQPMGKFTILTPPADYDPLRAMTGMIIQEWLRAVGIPASAKPMAIGSLIQQVKGRRDFDAFILGYGSLDIDPDWIRNFFHSNNDKLRGWNMSGYKNPAFDRIADDSASTLDREKRRKLIWEMQKIILHDIPYIPLYNPKIIEAVRNDKFSGWVAAMDGIGNIWSFCEVKPK
ncbi:MAG: ABC transporter substrate-binding protein [Thermodesulfobacteriota bacterium]